MVRRDSHEKTRRWCDFTPIERSAGVGALVIDAAAFTLRVLAHGEQNL